MTSITFLGAAKTVTGSKYLLDTGSAKVLVDAQERRARIVAEVEAAAKAAGGSARIDADNLQQVVCLVEWPKAVSCSPPSASLASVNHSRSPSTTRDRTGLAKRKARATGTTMTASVRGRAMSHKWRKVFMAGGFGKASAGRRG